MTCPHFFYGNCQEERCICPIVGQEREEFLADLHKYKEQLGAQVHISLNLLIEKWENYAKIEKV